MQGRRAKKPKKAEVASVLPPSAVAFIGQDVGLTLFHALGKLLYNKRDARGSPVESSEAAEGLSTQSQQTQHAQQAQQAEHNGNGVINLISDGEEDEDVRGSSQTQNAAAASTHWCELQVMLCMVHQTHRAAQQGVAHRR